MAPRPALARRLASALGSAFSRAADMARLMVGQSSYQAYLDHMAASHPHAGVMDEKTFFRHCQQARYGGGKGGRCC